MVGRNKNARKFYNQSTRHLPKNSKRSQSNGKINYGYGTFIILLTDRLRLNVPNLQCIIHKTSQHNFGIADLGHSQTFWVGPVLIFLAQWQVDRDGVAQKLLVPQQQPPLVSSASPLDAFTSDVGCSHHSVYGVSVCLRLHCVCIYIYTDII